MIFNNLFGKTGDKLAQEGIDDYRKGRDEFEVISKLEKALKLGLKHYPLDKIYLHIGSAFFDVALFEKAKDAYEKAYEHNKNDHTIMSNLGLAYKEIGDTERAIEFFNASLKVKPDYSYAHHNIGLYLYERGEHFEAIESLNRAIQFNPNLAVSYAVKARCLAYLGQKKAAMTSLKDATKKGYDNGDVLKAELEEIDNGNPKIYWNEGKFFEFCKLLSDADESFIDEVKMVIEDPISFYKNNKDAFALYNLTQFEIKNAIQWFFLPAKLNSKYKIIHLQQDENGDWIIGVLRSFLAEKMNSEEIAREIIDEARSRDIELLIALVACRLKITYSLELLHVWSSGDGLFVCLVNEKEWIKLDYPFVNVDGGFGKISPIATDEMIAEFLFDESK